MFACSSSSADAMNELITPLGRIKLDNPINIGYIDAPGRQIRRQQQSILLFTLLLCFKFRVDACALLLVDLTVKFPNLMLQNQRHC